MIKKIILIIGILGLGFVSNANIVQAQIYDEAAKVCRIHPNYEYEIAPETTPKHLALARIFASEGGYDGTADYVPIHRVLKNRSKGGVELTLNNMMRYSPNSFNFHSDHFARYIPYLNELGEQPLHWEERYPDRDWGDFRDKWLRALEIARRLVNGEQMPSSCSGRVDHWGMNRPDMIAQGYANGNVPVRCRGTKNIFWRIVRR